MFAHLSVQQQDCRPPARWSLLATNSPSAVPEGPGAAGTAQSRLCLIPAVGKEGKPAREQTFIFWIPKMIHLDKNYTEDELSIMHNWWPVAWYCPSQSWRCPIYLPASK